MKRIITFALMVFMVMALVACSGGVSQEEYDRVVAELETLKSDYNALEQVYNTVLDEYAAVMANNEVERIMGQQETADEASEAAGQGQEPDSSVALQDNIPDEPFFEYTGNGDDVVMGLTTETFAVLKSVHADDGRFAIKAHYGDSYDLLVNTTDSYNGGSTLLFPNREYTLEVSASGEWTVQAFLMGTSSTDTFSGTGDFVTPVFIASSNVYEIVADGEGHFAVKGYYNDGSYDLLVNTTDPYSGTVMLKNAGDYSFFEITGTRDFTITPK